MNIKKSDEKSFKIRLDNAEFNYKDFLHPQSDLYISFESRYRHVQNGVVSNLYLFSFEGERIKFRNGSSLEGYLYVGLSHDDVDDRTIEVFGARVAALDEQKNILIPIARASIFRR